jgi:N4-gp56 family major capsid protein
MAITTSTSLSQEFVDQLSQELILEPDPQYVFALLAGGARAGALGIPDIMGAAGASANMQQAMGAGLGTLRLLDQRWMSVARDFAMVVSEPTTPGKVILVDQPRYIGGTFTEVSRRLTEGTPVSATPQAATMGQVTVTIREYAGPHDGAAVAPIGITDFLKRRATHNLVEYVGTLLRRDRNKLVDHVISDLLLATTHVTTPGDVAEGSLVAGSKLTEDELSEMLRKLQERNIPTFSNGLYMCVMSPKHFEDLRADTKFRESVRYLGTEGALVSGHVANHGGFMMVISSNIPTAGVGAGGAVTGYRGVAFGPQAIGWGIGMDAEARRSKDDDYGREDRVLWIAHEGWALLDADFVQRFTST